MKFYVVMMGINCLIPYFSGQPAMLDWFQWFRFQFRFGGQEEKTRNKCPSLPGDGYFWHLATGEERSYRGGPVVSFEVEWKQLISTYK